MTWSEFFEGVFAWEDRNKRACQDVERVNALINALEAKPIPIEVKRRKGRILKEIRRAICGNLEIFYTRSTIRYAINLQRIED